MRVAVLCKTIGTRNSLRYYGNRTCLSMSLKTAREQLLLAFDDDDISDEELLLLYDVNRSSNLDLPYDNYPPFDLEDMEDDECLAEFRVRKNDLPRLAEALQIPNEFTCEQRSVIPGIEGLCMLLKRLAYPCRYVDMLPRFGRPLSVLCLATKLCFGLHFYNSPPPNHSVECPNTQPCCPSNLCRCNSPYGSTITALLWIYRRYC